jgi:hypothetical protein
MDESQMAGKRRSQYFALRRAYEPKVIRLVIVAESPPASGRYFYNPSGASTEPLFSAMMRQLQFSPGTKKEGLCEFQRQGWVLVDATYQPVNRLDGPARNRNSVIERDYPLLRDDLAALMRDQSIPLILIKANVCRRLEPKLREDGFSVLNAGRVVYFPSNGRQAEFQRQFREILESAGIGRVQ